MVPVAVDAVGDADDLSVDDIEENDVIIDEVEFSKPCVSFAVVSVEPVVD